ncbi:MAG: hypothetical protein UU13_C0010G0007 [Candidatus Nomurabacteria bacterium GW2011_GWB1_40_7]|uniref:Uncharacterized protein n=1 Tax=Candidatus Nomurabacteria bacterium GW2011_GWB1_40_7 TaxID=1618744 RepID=A0A0G0W4Q6_9BACT|nr:MAG: hypothetical protein UU13_C0010G0007 [Candidatus Nomurabacteria bacterium GW2011_GWB1_40_7]
MTKIFSKKKNGYAVLELLFYIAFFVALSLIVIDAMVTMAGSFRETAIQAELAQSGSILERIGREIRTSHDISSVSAADLTLSAKDADGADKTVRFLLSGSDAQLLENGVLVGNLNTPNISVMTLSFAPITTAKGKAVKILLTVKSNNDASNRIVDFYDTVVLRGSY